VLVWRGPNAEWDSSARFLYQVEWGEAMCSLSTCAGTGVPSSPWPRPLSQWPGSRDCHTPQKGRCRMPADGLGDVPAAMGVSVLE